MKIEKTDLIIQRYQLEHLVPLAITLLSIYFWISFFAYAAHVFVGIFINFIGLSVWWSAKLTLGDNWDAGYGTPRIRKLVTRGVYSKIGHPLYWGINITLLGLTILYPAVWFACISGLIILYFFYRMHVETKYLLQTLRDTYATYRKTTWL
jgi:protein-S-isoprenylcysteine O-methyltransferase Ste14